MSHTILKTPEGLFAFGDNSCGQLGLGNNRNVKVPTKLIFFKLLQIFDVCCGTYHTIVNTTNGLYVFGSNYFGELGLGNTITSVSTPTKLQFFGDLEIISISCGNNFTMINTKNGLYSFGNNCKGQLGLGHTENVYIPEKCNYFNDVEIIEISCGLFHTIINTNDGLYVFGNNEDGQLGLGNFLDQYFPIKCKFFEKRKLEILSVSCGNDFTIINTYNGLYCFGSNYYGQLGFGNINKVKKPKKIKFFKSSAKAKAQGHETSKNFNILNISCGHYHTIVHIIDGQYSFGYNEYGQLGLGDRKNRKVPTKIPFNNSLFETLFISCGSTHTIIHTTNGLYVFGSNYFGQLGLSNIISLNIPTKSDFDLDIIPKKQKRLIKSARSVC